MQIGELARELSVTTKTLRHYEKIGLLPPAERSKNGYRRYAPGTVARAHQIVALRRLGLSLGDITDLLNNTASGELRRRLMGVLDEKRQAMTLEISVLQGKLDEMEMRFINLMNAPAARSGDCICALLNKKNCTCGLASPDGS